MHNLSHFTMAFALFIHVAQAATPAQIFDQVTRTILQGDPHPFPFYAHLPYALECTLSTMLTLDHEPAPNPELYFTQAISKFLSDSEFTKAQENNITKFMDWFTGAFPAWLANENWLYYVPGCLPNDPSMKNPMRDALVFAIMKCKLDFVYKQIAPNWEVHSWYEIPEWLQDYKWNLPMSALVQNPMFFHYEEAARMLCRKIDPNNYKRPANIIDRMNERFNGDPENPDCRGEPELPEIREAFREKRVRNYINRFLKPDEYVKPE